jgi:hypothetical protein
MQLGFGGLGMTGMNMIEPLRCDGHKIAFDINNAKDPKLE